MSTGGFFSRRRAARNRTVKTVISVYRPLLWESWRAALSRRLFWVLGALASLLATGGLSDLAFRAFKRISQTRSLILQWVSGSLPGYDTVSDFFLNFVRLEPWRQTVVILLGIIIGVVVLAGAVFGQGVLLSIQSPEKRPLRFLFQEVRPLFWRLLGVDILAKAGVLLALLVTTPFVLLVSVRSFTRDALLYLVALGFFFIFAVAIQLWQMLALSAVVRGKKTLHEAFHEGVVLLGKHAPVVLEFGFLLFLLSLVGVVVTGLALFLVSGIGFFVLTSFLTMGWPYAYLTASLCLALVLILIAVGVNGIVTGFQYAAWGRFYERVKEGGVVSKIVSFLKK
ncbi:MAG TPA: hypothetical protein VJB99_02050 [Patescibacteria group bacterium]|nr:hypothetical protein [Patescibacteria group bacterium]